MICLHVSINRCFFQAAALEVSGPDPYLRFDAAEELARIHVSQAQAWLKKARVHVLMITRG